MEPMIGTGVPLNARPMGAAIATASTVAMQPLTEAAMPAMWPKGSNASAFRLPSVRPAVKNTLVVQKM
ncbi:hypothetical protein GALL_463410 [mine drainage metagenome]|uniref:Uncharacterized protein n=1 Tax=mine drainage metagenome TaxID=410659 RepID=A0A1J5PWV1_9ZZZZ